MTVFPPPKLLFSVSPIEPPFCYNWSDWGRIAGGAEHSHRIRLPGYSSTSTSRVIVNRTLKVSFLTMWQHQSWKLWTTLCMSETASKCVQVCQIMSTTSSLQRIWPPLMFTWICGWTLCFNNSKNQLSYFQTG
jgi:hypothetical protein